MPKVNEVTLAELFTRDDKDHPFGGRPRNLAQSLAPMIKVELSKECPEIDWDPLKNSIEDQAVAMLDIPLVTNILLPAWRKYQDLESRIANDPEGKVVWLAKHTVSSVHRPHLDVFIKGVRVAPVAGLEVAADFTLNGFGLVVHQWKITKIIRTGMIEGSGSVGLKDFKLDKSFGKIELEDTIDLREPYALQ